MMKFSIKFTVNIILILFTVISLKAQVGINTTNPKVTLEIAANPNNLNIADGIIIPRITGVDLLAKDNLYNQEHTSTIVYVIEPLLNSSEKTINIDQIGYYYYDGNIWQKFIKNGNSTEINGSNGLTINGNNIKLGGNLNEATTIGTTSDNTIKFKGLQPGEAKNDKVLVIDSNGVLKSINNVSNELSIPSPAIFTLNAPQSDFLKDAGAGSSAIVEMVQTKNAINGLTYNEENREISFPAGIYQMIFVYEATHNQTNCTISSYIVDFPTDNNFQRIHSTAYHNQGSVSNHGGTITYVTNLTAEKKWKISLGRGQSGNCSGAGNELAPQSTQLLIFRIGN